MKLKGQISFAAAVSDSRETLASPSLLGPSHMGKTCIALSCIMGKIELLVASHHEVVQFPVTQLSSVTWRQSKSLNCIPLFLNEAISFFESLSPPRQQDSFFNFHSECQKVLTNVPN